MRKATTVTAGRLAERVAYAAVLACAVLVRLVGLFHHATMPDEAFTFFIAAHPLPAIVDLLKSGDFHPPLVYLIGHALLRISNHAYLFRLVSAAFGVAGVTAAYAIGRRIIPHWALLAALLVALAPPLAFFDGFFRMYPLLWSLGVITWAVLLWALDEPRSRGRWIFYALCLCALLYTQYLAFFIVAAQIGYVTIFFRRSAGFWMATAVALAAFSLWLPVFLVQYPLGGTAYNALQGHLSQMFVAPAVLLIDGLPAGIEFHPLILALLWLSILGGVAVAVARKCWPALALLAPVILQVGYSLAAGKLLFGQRYLLHAIPALVIALLVFVSWLWSTRLRPAALGLLAALTVMMLAGTLDKHFLPQYMPIDWTEYRNFLDRNIQPGDAVVFDGSMVYYVLVGSKAATGRPLFLVSNRREASLFGEQAARYPRVWYIDYQSQLPDPQHTVFFRLQRSHPQHKTWRSTEAAYGDVVLTTLFLPAAKRGP